MKGKATLANVDQLTKDLAVVTARLREGQGSLGLMINDRRLYDDLHRIKTYTGLPGSYTYDAVGNITTSIEGGGSPFTYASRRTQAVKTAFGKTYLYDLCGNMIVRGSQALEYDQENRLARLTQAGALVMEYGYSAADERLWKRKFITMPAPRLRKGCGERI